MNNLAVPQQLDHLLAMSHRIVEELNEREPSANHLAELYLDRARCLQQLNESLNHPGADYSDEEQRAAILPKLDKLALLDEHIISGIRKLREEKEQELNDLRKESRSIKSYRQNTAPRSNSFFLGRELEG